MESHVPLRQTKKNAPLQPHIESQKIDLELITDSIDAIQVNGLIYVDELPDGSPHFVASHGLPTFESSLPHDRNQNRPLVSTGSVEYEGVENLMKAPSTSYSSHFLHGPSHVTCPKNVPIMPVFKGSIPEHRDHLSSEQLRPVLQDPFPRRSGLKMQVLERPLKKSGIG